MVFDRSRGSAAFDGVGDSEGDGVSTRTDEAGDGLASRVGEAEFPLLPCDGARPQEARSRATARHIAPMTERVKRLPFKGLPGDSTVRAFPRVRLTGPLAQGRQSAT